MPTALMATTAHRMAITGDMLPPIMGMAMPQPIMAKLRSTMDHAIDAWCVLRTHITERDTIVTTDRAFEGSLLTDRAFEGSGTNALPTCELFRVRAHGVFVMRPTRFVA